MVSIFSILAKKSQATPSLDMLIGASSQGWWLRVQFLEPEDLCLNLSPATIRSLGFPICKMG